MKPQQQNTDVEGNSHVFVQMPDGKAINVPAEDPPTGRLGDASATDQTADHTPTTHSSEVTSGEDA